MRNPAFPPRSSVCSFPENSPDSFSGLQRMDENVLYLLNHAIHLGIQRILLSGEGIPPTPKRSPRRKHARIHSRKQRIVAPLLSPDPWHPSPRNDARAADSPGPVRPALRIPPEGAGPA